MHNTGNPLGSKDILDLYDNSETIDNFVNSQQDEVPDRFGTKRLTLAGLIKRSMALRNEINDFSSALTFKPEWSDVPMNVSEGVGGEGGALNLQAEALGNRSEINKITSREALRRSCAEAGYTLVTGSFEAGGTLVKANDVLLQECTGKVFSGPAGAVAAGANPASGPFVDRSSALFRSTANMPSLAALSSLSVSRSKVAGYATVVGDLPGVYQFVSSNLSTEVASNPVLGFYVPPTEDPSGASGAWVRKETRTTVGPDSLSPLFIEQFINGFGGRGMLTAEPINVTTERQVTASGSAGDTAIAVSDTVGYAVGGRVVIYHDTVSRYETYFVSSLSPTTIGFVPGLLYPVTSASRVERLWFNRAHPGKFYIRKLAQDIARGREFEGSAPGSGRLYFSQFDSDPTDANDLATPIGGASISYINQLNISQGFIDVPLESSIGRALFVTVSANGQGAKLPSFETGGVTDAVISCVAMARNNTIGMVLQLRDSDGFVQAKVKIPATTQRVAKKYNFPVKLPGRTKSAHLELVAESGVTGQIDIILDQVEVYSTSVGRQAMIPRDRRLTVVALGDSWVAGDLASTPEREPLTTQLARELPLSRIVNAGVGGNAVQDLLARFDTDVAPYKPDYVIVNTGTNDSYNPASEVFFPNAVDFFEYTYNQLISKITSIGARPIIIGVPALAQSDLESASTNWELNDRAKTYSRYFWKRFSSAAEAVQSWLPQLAIGDSYAGITYASRSGWYERVGNFVHFTASIVLSNKGASAGAVTIPNLPVPAKSGVIVPMATTVANVQSALNVQAVLNISTEQVIRLQVPSASGTTAATEANITNNTAIWISGSYPAQSV